ncbi:MAG TPA: DinB family protein [Thermoanaerobaculia bacterium]|nr:DinB family protein [Thermoanaerobaculia bacterium]
MDTRETLLASLRRAYDGRSWHGPNLRGALRGLKPEVAFFHPGPGRHSVYDLVLHAAYWKYVARRRLTGEKRGSFPFEGSNFFPEPKVKDARAVNVALAALDAEHAALRTLVEGMPEAAFAARHGRWTAGEMIAGVAAHDLYHAGQIQLVKKLGAKGGGRRPATAARTPRSSA